MMNNTAKSADSGAKSPFFSTFGTTIGTFHIFPFDIPSLILRYAFASLTEADRVHYGG